MAYWSAMRFLEEAKTETVYARTVSYLKEHMRQFIRPQDRALICIRNPDMTGMLKTVVTELDAIAVQPEDFRWQTMLKTAFFSRATVVMGSPLVIMGLFKVARYTGTPLNVRHVMLGGAPSEPWMIRGIRNGLDATLWGCYDPVPGLVVAGFSCPTGDGVHLREDILAEIDPETEQVMLSWKHLPEAVFHTVDRARIGNGACVCGCDLPKLVDFQQINVDGDPVIELQKELLSWTSVLDCRARKTEMGLELEMVVFPGERLPKLPTCAKRCVRQWNPKEDAPFTPIFSPKID